MANRFAFSTLSQIPSGIWVLGFVSMLMDISSEMVHSLLPMFMVTVLGTSMVTVGLIEGVAEATALIVRIFSGVLSDYLGKRKEIVLFGYGLSALTKPLFALANSIGLVFAARFMDRVGKGIRGAPRDALIADLAPIKVRGASFGLRQSLDTVGAVLGPLFAFCFMILVSNNFRVVFALAIIPALIAVFLIIVGVKDPDNLPHSKLLNPLSINAVKQLPYTYWWVCSIGAVITLARFSEAFLLLRAMQGGMSLAAVPLVLMMMNLVYSFTAYPFGKLADYLNHNTLLIIGLIVLAVADLVLAYSNHWVYVLIGVSLWGIHMGSTQGLLAAMVADTSPVAMRGTAYGLFNLMSGITMILASTIAGILWERFGAAITFYMSSGFCLLALMGLILGRRLLK